VPPGRGLSSCTSAPISTPDDLARDSIPTSTRYPRPAIEPEQRDFIPIVSGKITNRLPDTACAVTDVPESRFPATPFLEKTRATGADPWPALVRALPRINNFTPLLPNPHSGLHLPRFVKKPRTRRLASRHIIRRSRDVDHRPVRQLRILQ